MEDEFDWLGRARYARRPDDQRGLRNYGSGLRNGFARAWCRPADGELEAEIPQVRAAAEVFATKLFPRGTKLTRTEPLSALVIGAFVRSVDARCGVVVREGGAGKAVEGTASRVCGELTEGYEAFKPPRTSAASGLPPPRRSPVGSGSVQGVHFAGFVIAAHGQPPRGQLSFGAGAHAAVTREIGYR
jgi:hypothetical protein